MINLPIDKLIYKADLKEMNFLIGIQKYRGNQTWGDFLITIRLHIKSLKNKNNNRIVIIIKVNLI